MDAFFFHILNGLIYHNTLLDTVVLFFAEYLPYLLAAAYLFYLLFGFSGSRARIQGIVVGIIACGAARLVAEVIRVFYHRPRPFVALETPHLLTVDSWSFPSGHASAFFALSTIVYGYNKKLGVAFFILSALMGCARISAGVHYPSDIIAGAIIGVLSGNIVLMLSKKLLKN